jgi:hypothetical protein
MKHESIPARIEIRSPGQNKSIQLIQHTINVIIVIQGWDDDRDPTGSLDAIEVACRDRRISGPIIAGRTVVCIQSN